MDKYYTPDISDLFVGYECEYMIGNQFTNFSVVDVTTSIGAVESGILRTPYLTKEQIEKEGWKYYSELVEGDDVGNLTTTAYVYQKNGFTCRFSVSGNEISFFNKQINRDQWWERPIYHGKCPSINEFRKICKLLGI